MENKKVFGLIKLVNKVGKFFKLIEKLLMVIKKTMSIIELSSIVKKKYENSGLINHLVVDDLLPKEIASKLALYAV